MTTVSEVIDREQAAPVNSNMLPVKRARRGVARFKSDESGSHAIEFAAVSAPFLALTFALFGLAFYFFILNSVEKGMDQVSRQIRTGEAAKNNMTVQQFKNAVCAKAGGWVKCNKMQIFVSKFATWADVKPQKCVDSSGVVISNSASGSSKIADYSGTASDIVIVTACYKWEFTKKLPYLHIGNMADKSYMMQAATAFRSEPFENN